MEQKLYKLYSTQKDFYWFEFSTLKKSEILRDYVMGTAYYDLKGHFDPEAMEKAYFEIMKRCDSFRMRLVTGFLKVRQYFYDPSEIPVPTRKTVRDVSELRALIEEPEYPEMSVFGKYLTFAELVTTEDGCGGIILWQHHICTDGYTVSNLVYPQLCELYDCFRNNEIPPEPKKIYTFEAFLQNEQKKKSSVKSDYLWWVKYSNRHLFRFSVPVRRRKKHDKYVKSKREISGERFERLEKYCAENVISDNSVLMAVLSVLVASVTKARRFNFYMQYHGRNTFLKKKTPGAFLLSLLPMFEPDDKKTLQDYAVQVHRDLMDVSVHARFSDVAAEFYYPYVHLFSGFRDLNWLMINNIRGYSTEEGRSLDLFGNQRSGYYELVCFDTADIEGKPGILIESMLDGELMSQSRLEEVMDAYMDMLDMFLDADTQSTVADCRKIIKK